MAQLHLRYSSDADRWRAVVARDAMADSLFLYGVRTTRIFCRPNCKARLPRRANVVFFLAAAEAERAGFRACKRCKPAAGGTMPEDQAAARIRAMLHEDVQRAGDDHRQPSPADMAARAGVSRWHFHRTFKQVAGMTPLEYIESRKQTAVGRGRRRDRQQQNHVSEGAIRESPQHSLDSTPTELQEDEVLDSYAALGSTWLDCLGARVPQTESDADIDLATLDAAAWDMGTRWCEEYLETDLLLQGQGTGGASSHHGSWIP